jgi:hypothetical protein
MHYRTELVNFLDPPDAFLDALGWKVVRPPTSELVVDEHLHEAPRVVLLSVPA